MMYIGLLRHDGQVTWMNEETYKAYPVFTCYVAVLKVKIK